MISVNFFESKKGIKVELDSTLKLSFDSLLEIFLFISPKEIINIILTCKLFHDTIEKSDFYWKVMSKLKFNRLFQKKGYSILRRIFLRRKKWKDSFTFFSNYYWTKIPPNVVKSENIVQKQRKGVNISRNGEILKFHSVPVAYNVFQFFTNYNLFCCMNKVYVEPKMYIVTIQYKQIVKKFKFNPKKHHVSFGVMLVIDKNYWQGPSYRINLLNGELENKLDTNSNNLNLFQHLKKKDVKIHYFDRPIKNNDKISMIVDLKERRLMFLLNSKNFGWIDNHYVKTLLKVKCLIPFVNIPSCKGYEFKILNDDSDKIEAIPQELTASFF